MDSFDRRILIMVDPDEIARTGTWGQHWIEPTEKVRTANLALASMRGSGARWWRYSVSHCSFEMIVGKASVEDNLVLSLSACEHISGPVEWQAQRIDVTFQPDPEFPNSGIYTLQDGSVQFRAVGKAFRWKRGWDMWAHDGFYLGRGGKPTILAQAGASPGITREAASRVLRW
jgi:hypothetical protein